MRVQKGYVNTTWTKEGTGIFDVGNIVCVTQSTPAAVLLGRIYPSFCRAACEFSRTGDARCHTCACGLWQCKSWMRAMPLPFIGLAFLQSLSATVAAEHTLCMRFDLR